MDCETTDACLKYLKQDDSDYEYESDDLDDDKPFDMISEPISSSDDSSDDDESSGESESNVTSNDVELQPSFKSSLTLKDSVSMDIDYAYAKAGEETESEDEDEDENDDELFPRLDIAICMNKSLAYLSDTESETDIASDTNNYLTAPKQNNMEHNLYKNYSTSNITNVTRISSSCLSSTSTQLSQTPSIKNNNGISLMKIYCQDELGINRSDNHSYRDFEMSQDANWWVSGDYFIGDSDDDDTDLELAIDYEYHTSVIDYGVLI